MSRLAMLTPPETGHLNPSLGVAEALRRRGHEVIFYQLADRVARIEACGFDCRVLCSTEYPIGSIEKEHAELGRRSGWRATWYTAKLGEHRLRLICRDVLDLIREDQVEGIIADEVMAVGRTVGEVLQVPTITLSNALPLRMSRELPPPVSAWPYRSDAWGYLRNQLGKWVLDRSSRYSLRDVRRFQREHGCRRLQTLNDLASPLAHVCQIPRSFDFPIQRDEAELEGRYVYAGPFRDVMQTESSDFPFDRLDGRPLIYVSFGTLQNRVGDRFREIARLCGQLPVQAVLSLGGGGRVEQFGEVPENVVVVEYAPQLELLRRADLCITHAGMNTTLECLALGVPMVTIPVANDQPAVAARVLYHGVGLRMTVRQLRSGQGIQQLRRSIESVLHDQGYRERARRFSSEIQAAPGAETAADVVDRVFVG